MALPYESLYLHSSQRAHFRADREGSVSGCVAQTYSFLEASPSASGVASWGKMRSFHSTGRPRIVRVSSVEATSRPSACSVRNYAEARRSEHCSRTSKRYCDTGTECQISKVRSTQFIFFRLLVVVRDNQVECTYIPDCYISWAMYISGM